MSNQDFFTSHPDFIRYVGGGLISLLLVFAGVTVNHLRSKLAYALTKIGQMEIGMATTKERRHSEDKELSRALTILDNIVIDINELKISNANEHGTIIAGRTHMLERLSILETKMETMEHKLPNGELKVIQSSLDRILVKLGGEK